MTRDMKNQKRSEETRMEKKKESISEETRSKEEEQRPRSLQICVKLLLEFTFTLFVFIRVFYTSLYKQGFENQK